MRFIRQLSWLLRVLLFLAIFAFALMNTDSVEVRFLPGHAWETPMIVLLLLFFACGAAIGVLACLSRLFGQRREIQRLQRALRTGAGRGGPPAA
ncbi:MAG TPA: LapA family protein [Burkholderiales bacterium]|nr:LapA family protein [Burkholderiales bacterium]